MLDITSISAIITAVGVLFGVVFAVLELRNLVQIRQTDIIIQLFSVFNQREFQEMDLKLLSADFKDYDDFVEKYGPFSSQKPIHVGFRMVAAFFEAIGILHHRKLIDIGLVSELFSVKIRWNKVEKLAVGLRKLYDEPKFLEWFENLNNEIQMMEQ